MTQKVWELLTGIDLKAADMQIVLHCAPFLAGLRISNLLILQKDQAARVRWLFAQTRFSYVILYSSSQKEVMLLYREQELNRYLGRGEVRTMLREMGYRDFSTERLLEVFAARYVSFMQGRNSFPHEMGLFLGYPLEDVRGFIEHNGRNAVCAGYWKVYENQPEKQLLFHGFHLAEEGLVKLMAQGFRLEDILKYA